VSQQRPAARHGRILDRVFSPGGFPWLDAFLLVSARLLVSLVVWWSGFRAISDDDYARVVIAQKFASAPALDPSGTSWLPFPFWLQGSAMLLFGPELSTAVGVAWVSGAASTLLVWLAARTLGLTRRAAFFAAILASGLAYSAWLGVATVPELLTAGLTLYGAATLAVPVTATLAVPVTATLAVPLHLTLLRSERAWGAVALCCATLSRYETWPVAAVFAVLSISDARRAGRDSQARRGAALCALVASAGMLLWLAHGVARHNNATFFVERVANYQKALGGHDFDAWAALSRHPGFLFEYAPALMVMAVLGLGLARFAPRSQLDSAQLAPLVRPLLACASLFAFLVVGDLRGAGATHHPARTLLPIWFLACIAVTHTLLPGGRVLRAGLLRGNAFVMVVLSILVVDGLKIGVLDGARLFVGRSEELQLGEHARRVCENRASGGRLLIAPKDYGYFAMIAAFAAPARVDVFDDLDPRHARQQHIFASARMGSAEVRRELRDRLERDHVVALVVSRTPDSTAQPDSMAQPDSTAQPDSMAQPDSTAAMLHLRRVATTANYELLAVSPAR